MTKQYFYYHKRGNMVRVTMSDIHYVEQIGKDCLIHTSDQSHHVETHIRKLEPQLASAALVRVHTNFLVKLDKIERVDLAKAKVYTALHVIEMEATFSDDVLSRIEVLNDH